MLRIIRWPDAPFVNRKKCRVCDTRVPNVRQFTEHGAHAGLGRVGKVSDGIPVAMPRNTAHDSIVARHWFARVSKIHFQQMKVVLIAAVIAHVALHSVVGCCSHPRSACAEDHESAFSRCSCPAHSRCDQAGARHSSASEISFSSSIDHHCCGDQCKWISERPGPLWNVDHLDREFAADSRAPSLRALTVASSIYEGWRRIPKFAPPVRLHLVCQVLLI